MSVYARHTIPEDRTILTEMAKTTFERYVIRDAGGRSLPGYNVLAMQAEKERLLCEEPG